MLDFLRDVGKHVTVNQMLAKESVRSRLEGEPGISFTEFSYMLLQANDFRHLHAAPRRRAADGRLRPVGQHHRRDRPDPPHHGPAGPRAHVAACSLRSDGQKFGKSTGGAVWLDPDRTSPYQFRQFWMQTDDDGGRATGCCGSAPDRSTRSRAVIDEHAEAPERRVGPAGAGPRAHDAGARRRARPTPPTRPPTCCSAAIRRRRPATRSRSCAARCPTSSGRGRRRSPTRSSCWWPPGWPASKGDARRLLDQRGVRANGVQLAPRPGAGRGPAAPRSVTCCSRKGKHTYHLVEISRPGG